MSQEQGGRFEVCGFNWLSLERYLKNHSCPGFLEEIYRDHSKSNNQMEFLHEWLCKGKVKTIVVEFDYIDHHYLEDYVAYYVKCFHSYERRTKRLHFFKQEFDKCQLLDLLKGEVTSLKVEDLKSSYFGFVVSRPLAGVEIGRSCLRVDASGGKNFPCNRNYKVSLFGIELNIDSLAFQQQDRVVAACATVALWTCFQATGKRFHHVIPSPVEITKNATVLLPDNLDVAEVRGLPNNGLVPRQIAYAIRSSGLETQFIKIPPGAVAHLRRTVYAYLQHGIPCILGVKNITDKKGNRVKGKHAIALTGFKFGKCTTKESNDKDNREVVLRSDRISELYSHDDQIGAFAPMKLLDDGKGTTRYFDYEPETLMVPLYHKIRIPFDHIYGIVSILDVVLYRHSIKLQDAEDRLEKTNKVCYLLNLEWDIYLTDVRTYKKDILENYSELQNREVLLTESLPKFLWRVVVREKEQKVLEIIFDATGILGHDLTLQVVELNKNFGDRLRLVGRTLKAMSEKNTSDSGADSDCGKKMRQTKVHILGVLRKLGDLEAPLT